VHASGIDSDRVLLFGSGAAVGWGVLSHEMALPGSLARGLAALTGRGADVDVVTAPDLRIANANRDLGAVDLSRYDAVVLTLGLMEAVGLSSIFSWRRDLDALLSYLAEVAPRTAVFIVGIHATTQITWYDRMVAPINSHHRGALNRASAQLSAHRERVSFIPFDPAAGVQGSRARSKDQYREGGMLLAARIAPVLNEGLGNSGVRRRPRRGPLDTLARRNALETFAILDATRRDAFQRLTEFARLSLHTSAAAITIVGSDRFWTTASRGASSTEGPGSQSICFTTIEHEDALVTNPSRDPRFTDIDRLRAPPPVKFYAGYRIEAPNGVPIGVLCVHDWVEHDIDQFDLVLLRDLALLIQKEIWLASQETRPAGYTNQRVQHPVAIPVERTYAPSASSR
jgi:GAF domain-containing protein